MSVSSLRIYCWEGYDSQAVLAPFCHRTGIEVHARTFTSDVEAAHEVAENTTHSFDILNINNAYVKKFLHPLGRIVPLEKSRYESNVEKTLKQFSHLDRWSWSEDGSEKIGICQRFGTFNFVVNTRRISRSSAEDSGFDLAADPAMRGRYGILLYEDFNVFHICVAAGLDPFQRLEPNQEEAFESTARRWFNNAALVTKDHHVLNRALVEKKIDFYLSGGIYTASPARLSGHSEIRAITPLRGPIDGRGGIVFTEVTSALAHKGNSPWSEAFLTYLLESETAVRVAFVEGTCNPVLQMGDPKVMEAFSPAQLDAIQWDDLEEEVSRCADYNIVPNLSTLLQRLRKVRLTKP